MKASIASSAQCRSSTTSTAGPAAARPSRNARQAEKFSSREASSASRPSSGRRRARRRSRSSPSGRTVSRRASVRATPSLSRMPAAAADDLRERPEGDVRAEGQAAALAPGDELGPVVEAAGELGQQAALADAGLADDEGEARRGAPRRPRRAAPPGRRAPPRARRSSVVKLRSSEPVRARGAVAIQARSGWLLPLRVTGWQASKAKTFSVAACVASPTATAIGGAAALQAGGDVDGVAGEEALAARRVDVEAHEGLAGVDADADLDGLAADARQGVDLVDQAQAGAHGALGVVLVQRRARRRRRPRRRRCTSRRCRRRTRRRAAPPRSSGAGRRRRARGRCAPRGR